MEYRQILSEELTPALFDGFHRYQVIHDVWQLNDGRWVIRPAPRLIEDWGEEQHNFICYCLKETIKDGGFVYGAFLEGKLKGIVAVNAQPLGKRHQYRELPFLHISQECRGQGIGNNLFTMARNAARELGGEMLYISSQASVETQAFYKAMGCRDASEPIPEYIQHAPHERQLECSVSCSLDRHTSVRTGSQ